MTGDAARFQRVFEVFDEARQLAIDEREAFLQQSCGDDEALRAEVRSLLDHHGQPGGGLDQPVIDAALEDATATVGESAVPADTIDRYRLVRPIGEGGMGVVYLAEQTAPVRREVALKLLKPGLDSEQVIRRFEGEQQALAMMEHPGIARVLEAGTTSAGRPFFAMELVRGVPITTYCDRHRLAVSERIDLVIQACLAVQHAHQNGIIHRDLKPSNILVAVEGGAPVAKVIDFGVAKAVRQRLTEQSLHTELGQLIGTPEYMSPEQADLGALGVDTRTDVYSVGVVLYELLSGTPPFLPSELRSAGFDEVCRRIREDDPPRPSTRLSSLGDAASGDVARHRRSTRSAIVRELRGDLDWITMRAMEKDRTRRYASVIALAEDLRRHLDHEPVVAGPPTTVYRVRKFVRRHRAMVSGLAAVFLTLLAGITASALFAVGQARARVEAARQAAIAESVNRFLNEDLLGAADPHNSPDRTITVRTVLDRAADRIDRGVGDDALVEAAIRSTLGRAYANLAEYEAARGHLERALALRRHWLGEDHRDTLASARDVAELHAQIGEFDRAESMLVATRAASQRGLGPDDPLSLRCTSDLALLLLLTGRPDEAEPLAVDAYERSLRALGEEHVDTAVFMVNLAGLYERTGRLEEAEGLGERALRTRRRLLGDDHPETLVSINNVGLVYYYRDRFEKAEELYREAIERSSRVLGEEHVATMRARGNLALLQVNRGRYEEAEAQYVATLAVQRRIYGDDHQYTLLTLLNLGGLYDEQERYDEALTQYQQALDGFRSTLGPGHEYTLITMGNLGGTYRSMERLEEAEAMYRAAVEEAERSLPREHWYGAHLLTGFGQTLGAAGKLDEAETTLLEAHARLEDLLGPHHRRTASAAQGLVEVYESWGREEQAARWRASGPSAR